MRVNLEIDISYEEASFIKELLWNWITARNESPVKTRSGICKYKAK